MSTIPIFASPVLMFDSKGNKLDPGRARSKELSSLFFPSLTSARWADPKTPIYLALNFDLNPVDQAELDRLNITVLDADKCLGYGNVARRYKEFDRACPVASPDLGGRGLIGVVRFFVLQGAMEMMNLEMVRLVLQPS